MASNMASLLDQQSKADVHCKAYQTMEYQLLFYNYILQLHEPVLISNHIKP
jgi:hypothetical protein